MQLQDKEKIAYYAALSIFFGSIELFIPKILPFFRLGLANIPILLSLTLPFKPFLILLLLKGIGNSYISGNLFSFFAFMSIAQTLLSGIAMYAVNRVIKKHISSYGISMIGAIVSTYAQITIASLYLGRFVFSFLPLMLTISLFSSILIAFISNSIKLEAIPSLEMERENKQDAAFTISMLVISAFSIMAIDSVLLSFTAFFLALLFQHKEKRRIMILPHIAIILFMAISSLFMQSGRVLYKLGPIVVTQGALESCLTKAFKLSATVSLSQGYCQVLRPGNGIIGMTLGYFTALLSNFKELEGESIGERARKVLKLEELKSKKRNAAKTEKATLILFSILFVLLFISSKA